MRHLTVVTTIHGAGVFVDQRHVVGSHNHSRSLLRDLSQQLQDIVGRLGVEVAGGLVGDDHLRMIQDGPGDADTLLLTAGEFVGHLVSLVFHLHVLQHLADALVDFLLVLPASRPKHKTQVLIHVAVGEQLEILEDDSYLLSQCRNFLTADLQQIISDHLGFFSLVDVEFTIDGLQQAALTGTHTSDEIDKVAFVHAEVNIFKHILALCLTDVRFLKFNQHITIHFLLFTLHSSLLHLSLGFRLATLLVPVGIMTLTELSGDVLNAQPLAGEQHDEVIDHVR